MDGTAGAVFLECAGVCLMAVFLALLWRLIPLRRQPSRTADSCARDRSNMSTQTARRHQRPHDRVAGCPQSHGKERASVTSPPRRRVEYPSDHRRCDPQADLTRVYKDDGKRNSLEDQDAHFLRCPQRGMDVPGLPHRRGQTVAAQFMPPQAKKLRQQQQKSQNAGRASNVVSNVVLPTKPSTAEGRVGAPCKLRCTAHSDSGDRRDAYAGLSPKSKVEEIRPRRHAATWGMLAHLLLRDSSDNTSIASLSLFAAWKKERQKKMRRARTERRLWRLKSEIQRMEILESEMLELEGCAGASLLHTI